MAEERSTADRIADAVLTGAQVGVVMLPVLTAMIRQVNDTIEGFRKLGVSEAEMEAHLAASLIKWDALVVRVASYQAQRHPDDRD